MIRSSGHRGNADLGPVTNRTGRVEGHPVTASSRDTVYDPYLQAPTIVRPRILYLSAFQEPISYDGSQARQIGVEFFYQMLGTARQDSSCSTHGYSHAGYGVSSSDHYVPGPADRVPERSRNKRPDVVRDVPAPTQKRKKVKPSDWE
ncbi:hypothetical protein M9H77_07067 [Catharanthus roseus]|uniref:Uncharacterized protein n=2 Tax=Catharanthus roseus TaxID=4058 RepID=A0ACC0BTV8_CATRO|nr:hypothetical protein M9H77_07063 [Catharanthus roseus]KAI5676117.1 hypothetical protein M9H77_07067 [Catharanthus roseus]